MMKRHHVKSLDYTNASTHTHMQTHTHTYIVRTYNTSDQTTKSVESNRVPTVSDEVERLEQISVGEPVFEFINDGISISAVGNVFVGSTEIDGVVSDPQRRVRPVVLR